MAVARDEGVLVAYLPGLATAFVACSPRSILRWNGAWDRDWTIRPCSILLERYPSPAELAATSEKTLANRLTKLAPRMGKILAAEIVQALSEQAVVVPDTQAATIVVPRLAQQLASLRTQRDKVAGEVERLVHAHPLWSVLTSMPGVGVRSAARLLTEVAHKARVSRTSRRLRWPCAGHPTLELVYPWRTSIQAGQQGA